MKIEVYIDGACSGNPGPGGFGMVIRVFTATEKEFHYSGYCPLTTNNRMELLAAVRALEFLSEAKQADEVTIYSDSQYVVSGVNEWLENWIKKDFKGVKNPELWRHVVSLLAKQAFPVKFVKVKGHSDNIFNNKADQLATEAIKDEVGVDFELDLV